MSPETPQEGRFAARVAEFEAIAGSLYASAVHAGHTRVADDPAAHVSRSLADVDPAVSAALGHEIGNKDSDPNKVAN